MKARNAIPMVVALATVLLCATATTALAAADSLRSEPAPILSDSTEWIDHIPANSEEDIYLRYLQIGGAVPRYPWSLRGFSPFESKALSMRPGSHPWSRSKSATVIDRRIWPLPLSFQLRGNSSFPYGSNDGPVWAGRGLTASLEMGVALRAGPISMVLSPIAFIAQNASFELLNNGQTGELRFGDGMFPTSVDRPQRLGDKAYGLVDPGNSTLRIDIGPIAAGISTANLAWGPMELYPFVLGTNAAGFAHGFVGTARPLGIWLGSIHGRVIWGRLDQSPYSSVQGGPTYVSRAEPGTQRFVSGVVLLFEPTGLRGLELGVARFFHLPWPQSGIPSSYVRKPFENILKERLKGSPEFSDPASGAENQEISGFARWIFPSAGFEMYAEYGREDHSWDKRDFLQEPDHSRSYGLGFRKTLRLKPKVLEGLTVELINFQLPHLARSGRGEGSLYTHSVMRQGHTQRGQLLGADVGVDAAAGSTVRWDRYLAAGRTSVALHRVVRQDRGNFFTTGDTDQRTPNVRYALEIDRARLVRGVSLTTRFALIHEFNRNFASDATGVSVGLGIAVPLARAPSR